MAQSEQDVNQQQLGMSSRIGPVEIDWPRTIGYYGGLGLATALELVEPPLAIFIAAIPLFKMLNNPGASAPTRFVGQLLIGASNPVGGSGEATIQLTSSKGSGARRPTFMDEARQLANKMKNGRSRTLSETTSR
ncbi:MAG TPA: hypothetical protein VFA09_20400 [Ktedonobacteraceae bacterium]|jgi:hypothetical protein|nr:hypothetical protein [Ktedonobacteraceae bacterium]